MKFAFTRATLVRLMAVLLAATAPALSSCDKDDAAEELQKQEEAQKITDDATIQAYLTRNNITNFRRLDSGIYLINVTENASGKQVVAGSVVEVKSIGKLITEVEQNVVFDNSADQRVPCGCYSVTVGSGRFVKGYEEGLKEFKLGERKRMVIPSYLAKLSDGNFLLTPRVAQPIMFDVEVLSVL